MTDAYKQFWTELIPSFNLKIKFILSKLLDFSLEAIIIS